HPPSDQPRRYNGSADALRKTEFLWQSSDGSEVTAQVLPLGYAIGKYLPADENGLRKRLDSYFDVLEKASVTKEILLPNGH
ncbi:hypothetical protein O5264_29425, partial [Escherichia coli]|nr:hypothetical protein [Escherichia coli]